MLSAFLRQVGVVYGYVGSKHVSFAGRKPVGNGSETGRIRVSPSQFAARACIACSQALIDKIWEPDQAGGWRVGGRVVSGLGRGPVSGLGRGEIQPVFGASLLKICLCAARARAVGAARWPWPAAGCRRSATAGATPRGQRRRERT